MRVFHPSASRFPALAILPGLLLAYSLHAADWPMVRGDAARSAATPEPLELPLAAGWTWRAAAPPRPAWPRSERMRFDRAMQPVSACGMVLFGNSVDGRLTALDLESGQPAWTFTTEGPIRFAPALWKDRAYAVSDDGMLYVLNLADGSLCWKHRGGPGTDCVLGNGTMISKWPARGGPVIADGIVYYAAGIWPSDGIHIHALDAESGKPIWSNTDSGSLYMPQPHGGANAESGIAAQGYLVVAGQRLLVPTGRAVPACFDCRTGALDYFHLQKYGHNGESLMMAHGDVFFNGGLGFGLAGGDRRAKLGTGQLAASEDGIVRSWGQVLARYQWGEEERKNKRGEVETVQALRVDWSRDGLPEAASILTTGRQVVLGGKGRVSLFDTDAQQIVWEAPAEGTVCGLAVSDGCLLATTDQGVIHAFGPEDRWGGRRVPGRPAGAEVKEPGPTLRSDMLAAETADRIILRAGFTEGYCLDLACGEGSLAQALAERTGLQIIAIDADVENVRQARVRLTEAGLYGTRVTVHRRDPARTGYPPYFADLIVSGRSLSQPLDPRILAEARRLQRPYGGAVCVGPPEELKPSIRGPLDGAGRWTHLYADPANTVNSGDRLIAGRLGMLWFRDIDFDVPSRHGRGPGPLFQNGRLIQAGLDGVIAVNAYNGRRLWHTPIPELLTAYDGDELMGVSGTGSNICIGGPCVYVRTGHRCLQLDAASGQATCEFETPPLPAEGATPNGANALEEGAGEGGAETGASGQVLESRAPWGFLAWSNGILFGTAANPKHVVTYRYVDRGGDMTRQLTESRVLFAIDPKSGERLWSYEARDSIRHNAIAIAGGRVHLIDRPPALFDRVKKPETREHPTGRLVTLDARTGRVLWENDRDIYGTMLAASHPHGTVLMSYQPTAFRLVSEVGGRMAAFRAADGDRLWDIKANYASRPTLNDRTIFTQGGAWDLLTGEPVPFEFKRSYGCGILASSEKMLLFRSATLGYYDLTGAKRTENFGGIRPGCWINALPAGGIVLLPDATAGCRCSYLNKAWIALQPQ